MLGMRRRPGRRRTLRSPRVAELDAIMSDYKQTSELMRLCKKFAAEVAEPAPVSDDLFFVLQKADEMSRRSDGAFDVTVGPVVQLWRIARRTQELPDPKEFAAARAKVGFRKVKLDPTRKTVQLTTPGMQLDLGGIAKGYAADEALKLLKEKFGIARASWGRTETSPAATRRRTNQPGVSKSRPSPRDRPCAP